MPNLDDELTRRFRSAERPIAIEGLFERIARRQARKQTASRIQAGLLAFAVIMATGAGFLALRASFTRAPLGPAIDPNVASPNGRIVLSRLGDDGHYHLFVARPDGTGLQQLTHGTTDDTDPAFSPDGRWITVVRIGSDGSEHVETVSFDRPDGPAREPQFSSMSPQPAWSADGSMIAVREGNSQEPSGTALLIVPFDGDSHVAHLAGAGADLANPSWSPDSRIVFAILGSADNGETGWDLATVSSDGGGFRWLLREAGDQMAPAWSPDGSRIAYLRQRDRGSEIWTIAPDGTDETLIASSVEVSLQPDMAWSPDGTAVLVSDGEWIYHVDASPEGDPTVNFLRLVRGVSPSSQPSPAVEQPSPRAEPSGSPEPSLSPSPASGRDIGLGFQVCQVSEIEAQFDGLGSDDTAYVATRADDGRCPPAGGATGYVAMDLDADGLADESYGPITCSVYYCRTLAAPDLDADVGRHELLVVEGAGSIMQLGVYAVGPQGDEPTIVRVEVGEPGDPEGGFVVGEPVALTVGGDEGWSYRLRCEDRPDGRFLIASSAFHEVDSDGPVRIHEATLSYRELRTIVVDVDDRAEANSVDPLGPQPHDLCGSPFPVP